MKILVVDDDKVSRILASKTLVKEKYEVLEAENAKQAIEYLESAEPIRLLLCDIMMPDMNGLELVHYINENLDFMELPIIMYTSKRDKSTVVKALKMGVKDYIAKPLKPDVLFQKVNKVLSNDIPAFTDKEEILKELQIDREAYDELIADLIDAVSSEIDEMRESIEQKDFERLLFIVDSYLTASLNLGVKRILNVFGRLEKSAKNKDADRSKKMVSAVERELNILRDEFKDDTEKTAKNLLEYFESLDDK